MKFRNFGKKSLTELEELVDSKNLSFEWIFLSTSSTKNKHETR